VVGRKGVPQSKFGCLHKTEYCVATGNLTVIPPISSSYSSDYINDRTLTHSLYLYVNLNILAQMIFKQQ